MIPVPDSDDEEFYNNNCLPTPQETKSTHRKNKSNDSAVGECNESETGKEGTQGAEGKRKLNGELVVIKTRGGERQTFLKKTRNLLWHCAPAERVASATSNSKRNSYMKNKTTYGSQSFNLGGSPVRNNGSSPKKPMGNS